MRKGFQYKGYDHSRPSSATLGDLGLILGPSRAILGSSWPIFELSWGHLGPSWGHLEAIFKAQRSDPSRMGGVLAVEKSLHIKIMAILGHLKPGWAILRSS